MHLNVIRVPEWPRLSWLAVCPTSSGEITCYVGDRVETGDGWFCEAAWAGPYSDGGFDETDVVFGSGARVRGEEVVFVASGTTIDRLHSLQTPDRVLVSNSMACLLACSDGSLLLSCTSYRDRFRSIINGLERYERHIPTTVGCVRLTYFDNLVWDGRSLRVTDKRHASRDFGSYEKYRSFLDLSVQELSTNAQATERRHPYGLVSTLSSGYDSAVATVLARQVGCTEAFGFDSAEGGRKDDGSKVAEALGMQFTLFETAKAPSADVLFLAAGSGEGGDALFGAARPLLEGRLGFFGHWGDVIWGDEEHPLDANIVRVGVSGTSFVEYRLVAGFLQCAVPMMGGRQIGDVRRIAQSDEFKPWSVGGDYDRPLCRRIVEEAGVPRDAFGRNKRGVFLRPPRPTAFLTPELREDYHRWLRSRRVQFVRLRTIPPSPGWDKLTLMRGVDAATRRRIHRYVIHWAVDRAIELYPKPVRAGGSSGLPW